MRDGVGRVGSVAVLGGTSDIGVAIARAFVADGARRVILAGRRTDVMEATARQLRTAGATDTNVVAFDADDVASHAAVATELFAHGDVDVVVVAFGLLGPSGDEQRDPAQAVAVLTTNVVGAGSIMLHVAAQLERQGHGSLVLLSSVAGERARASNFVYGASKAGIDTLAQGLSDRLVSAGVQVLVVRPGFVFTKMTAGFAVPPLPSTAQAVATAVVDGVRSGATTVWVPSTIRWVMLILRLVPRAIFRRLPI